MNTAVPGTRTIFDRSRLSISSDTGNERSAMIARRCMRPRFHVVMRMKTPNATASGTQPPVGTCGLTEHEARERYGDDIDIYKADFRPMIHTLGGSGERTMMKLIVDARTDRVLGAHMVGHDAGEIIQGIGIAIKCGATKAQFDATMAIHPTAAEEFVTMRTPVPRLKQAAE